MISQKTAMLFLALSVASQIEGAATKVAAGGAAIGAIALASKLFALRRTTEEMIKDPNAKQALEILNNEACMLSFRTTSPVTNGDFWWTEKNCEFKDVNPKDAFRLIKEDPHLKHEPVEDFKVSGSNSCIVVSGIKTREQLENFLERVDEAQAPVGGFNIPILRKWMNHISKP